MRKEKIKRKNQKEMENTLMHQKQT